MNEPAYIRSFKNSSFEFYKGQCDESSTFNNPPYLPRVGNDGSRVDYRNSSRAYAKTACLDTMQMSLKDGSQEYSYNTHSLYGYQEAIATMPACEEATGERCLIVSR